MKNVIDEAELRLRKAAGESHRDIAAAMGVHEASVSRACRRFGMDRGRVWARSARPERPKSPAPEPAPEPAPVSIPSPPLARLERDIFDTRGRYRDLERLADRYGVRFTVAQAWWHRLRRRQPLPAHVLDVVRG